jgi:hypothetical protein
MGKGTRIGLWLGAIVATTTTACEILEPLPPFEYDQELLLDASDESNDVDRGPDATLDTSEAGDVVSEAMTDARPTSDATGSDADLSIENPCPKDYLSCCGYTADAGSGDLYCYGVFACTTATCETCLSKGCDASTQFCCVPPGDHPPFCMDLAIGKLCGAH